MGLEKSIAKGWEDRKPYRRGKGVSYGCRNHGSCQWCRENRTYQVRKEMGREELLHLLDLRVRYLVNDLLVEAALACMLSPRDPPPPRPCR